VKAISVHTDEDARALHATVADESVLLGPTLSSYRDARKLVEAALQTGAQAVHPCHAAIPGLEQAVTAAGLEWLGLPVRMAVELSIGDGLVEARLAPDESDAVVVPDVAARAAEVVSGVDLTAASVSGASQGIARGGVALSVEVTASELARVSRWREPQLDDVWTDAAIEEGTDPHDPLLAVLTVWGADRDAAYALACAAWDQLVIEGPVVPRPEALGGAA
jgi:acetyl/propionyl-CoA carboxylase alpha subunit